MMKFLSRFYGVFAESCHDVWLRVCSTADPETPLSRFVTKPREITTVGIKPVAKRQLFMPPRNRKLSTFRVDGLITSQKWELAVRYVEPARGTVIAAAELQAATPIELKLRPCCDNWPRRHVSVTGWPAETSTDKPLTMHLANRMAARAVVVIR